jgi:hypothetical protein
MNGFTGNRAQGSQGRSGAPDRALTWNASAEMLPLVGRIAQEVLGYQQRLQRLRPEYAALERNRQELDWPRRARRYELQEEIVRVEAELRQAETELEALGVTVLDRSRGLVGFPTIVNDRRAFFSWQPGEERLAFWSYADDRQRRPVPEEWTQPVKQTSRRRPRPGKR